MRADNAVPLCDLRVFVDETAKAVAPDDTRLIIGGGQCGRADTVGALLSSQNGWCCVEVRVPVVDVSESSPVAGLSTVKVRSVKAWSSGMTGRHRARTGCGPGGAGRLMVSQPLGS